MDTESTVPEEAQEPGARELLPVLPIVLVVAWVVRSFEPNPWVSTSTALAIAVLGAALMGLPALFWVLGHGHRGLAPLALLGTLVGTLLLVAIVSSAVVGLTVRAGLDRTMETLERGAPIPGMGVMPWWAFVRAELHAAAIGATSAIVYWLLFVVGRRR